MHEIQRGRWLCDNRKYCWFQAPETLLSHGLQKALWPTHLLEILTVTFYVFARIIPGGWRM